ncbi:MAG: hypothetical protein AAGD14_04390 [Planctomycetota bacterium]
MSILARSVNAVALPALDLFTSTRFLKEGRRLRRAMREPADVRRANQLAALNDLLRHAQERVPMHRERLAGLVANGGLTSLDDYLAVAPLTKRDISSGFPDEVTDEQSDRDGWKYVASSGTVERVVSVMDFDRRDDGRAAQLYAWQAACGFRAGQEMVQIPPNICNVVCGTDATNEEESFRRELLQYVGGKARGRDVDISSVRGAFERRIIYRTRMLDPLATTRTAVETERLEAYWNRLRAERPHILHALPEYLYILSEWARSESKPPLGIPYLFPMGGLASPAMRTRIVEGLGGTFLDIYGTAELGPIAFESSPGEGMHVIHEHFLVEVVVGDRHAEPGEVGEVLITDLRNRAMPFIRYRVGDLGCFVEAPASSTDRMPRLRILGRADERIDTEAEGCLSGVDVRDLFFGELGCHAFRVTIRSPERFDVDYVAREGRPSKDEVKARLERLLGSGVRCRVREVESIAAERSGKFRFIRRASRETVRG